MNRVHPRYWKDFNYVIYVYKSITKINGNGGVAYKAWSCQF